MFAEGCEGECGVKNMECFAAGRNEGYTTGKQCIFYKKLLDAGMTQSKNDYFPRCQMSRSYSAMARLAHGGSPPAGQKQRSGYQ